MESVKSLYELLGAEIKYLYSAEKQLLKVIPKLIKGATHRELKASLAAHLDETKQQVVRLETIADMLEMKPTGKVCRGMEGIIKEGAEALSTGAPPSIYDLGIIAAARRVEHYEMAGYMTAIALADGLHLTAVAALLHETLFEEKGAEDSLAGQVRRLVETSSIGVADAGKPAPKRSHSAVAKVA